jgi:hypothetical protein
MKKMLFTLVCGLFFWPLVAQNTLQAARKYSEQKQYLKSANLLETFIAENPQRKYDVARAWWMQSYNQLQLGEVEAARESNTRSLNMRLDLRSSDIVENYLREAQLSLLNDDASSALVSLQQGMTMLIEDPLVYAQLNYYAAKAMKQLGQYGEASAYLDIAREVILIEVGESDPLFGEILYEQGELQLLQKDHAAAFESFSAAFYRLREPLKRAKSLLKAKQAFEQR